MPPANDNFANAIVLSGFVGATVGDNTGATAEPGEPVSSGRTIWWKWTCPRTNRFSFGTRQKPGLSQQSAIPTVLNVFTGTSLNDLTSIGVAASYAGWDSNGQVDFQANQDSVYYVRVDGYAGAQGIISLWWEPFGHIVPWNCGECLPVVGIGETCVGTYQPSVFLEGFKDFDVPAGSYILRYCGGAWNYRDGWVVSRVPQFADQTWPGQDTSGHFFHIRYHDTAPQIGHINEQALVSPTHGFGSQTPDAAQDWAFCTQFKFRHDAVTPITLHFTDEAYPDNSVSTLGIKAPLYTLYRVVPVLKESFEISIRTTVGVSGEYQTTFFIDNLTDEDFTGVTITLQPSGGVTTVHGSPAFVTFPALQQKGAAFFYAVAPSSNLAVIATLKLSDGFNVFQDMHFDLMTRITSPTQEASRFESIADTWRATIDFRYAGLPGLNVVATVQESGGVSNVRNASTIAPQTVFTLGQGPQGSLSFLFTPDPTSSRSVDVTIDLQDTIAGITFPSLRFGLFFS